MLFVVQALATVLAVVWLILLFMVTTEDWMAAAYARVVDIRLEVARLQKEDEERAAELAKYHGSWRR